MSDSSLQRGSGTRTLVCNALHETRDTLARLDDGHGRYLQLLSTSLVEELLTLGRVSAEARVLCVTSYLDNDWVDGGLHAREQGQGSNGSAHCDGNATRHCPRGGEGVGKGLVWRREVRSRSVQKAGGKARGTAKECEATANGAVCESDY